jgi:O-antigen/teichoic acid export membrane protein
MAACTVVIGLIRIYVDFGLSAGVVHRQDVTPNQLSSLYSTNLALASVFVLLLWTAAPKVADLYREPQLTSLLRWLSLLLVIGACGSQYRAIALKELKFKLLTSIDVMMALVGLLVATITALNGFGVYSLVAGALATGIVSTTGYVVAGWRSHRPRLRFRFDEIRYFFRYGAYQAGEQTLNYLNTQVDVLLIGKLVGPEMLGRYSVSKDLCMRPATIVNPVYTRVAFPIMSLMQQEQMALKHLYLSGLRVLGTANFPIYAFVFVAADPLSDLILGQRWHGTAPILRIMSIYFLLRSTGNPVGSMLMATGRVKRGFIWNLIIFFLIPPTLWIGSSWGMLGIAWSLVAMQLVLAIPNWALLVRPCTNATLREYFSTMIAPLSASILAAAIAMICMHPVDGPIGKLLVALVSGAAAYGAFTLLINREAVSLARKLI